LRSTYIVGPSRRETLRCGPFLFFSPAPQIPARLRNWNAWDYFLLSSNVTPPRKGDGRLLPKSPALFQWAAALFRTRNRGCWTCSAPPHRLRAYMSLKNPPYGSLGCLPARKSSQNHLLFLP